MKAIQTEPAVVAGNGDRSQHTLSYPIQILVKTFCDQALVDSIPQPLPPTGGDRDRRRRWKRRSTASSSVPATGSTPRPSGGAHRAPVHSRLGPSTVGHTAAARGVISTPAPSIHCRVSRGTARSCAGVEASAAVLMADITTVALSVLSPSETPPVLIAASTPAPPLGLEPVVAATSSGWATSPPMPAASNQQMSPVHLVAMEDVPSTPMPTAAPAANALPGTAESAIDHAALAPPSFSATVDVLPPLMPATATEVASPVPLTPAATYGEVAAVGAYVHRRGRVSGASNACDHFYRGDSPVPLATTVEDASPEAVLVHGAPPVLAVTTVEITPPVLPPSTPTSDNVSPVVLVATIENLSPSPATTFLEPDVSTVFIDTLVPGTITSSPDAPPSPAPRHVLPDNLIVYARTPRRREETPTPATEFIGRVSKKVDALVPTPEVQKRRKKTMGLKAEPY
ncbi:hypothetical protein C2845_PM04G12020 [Panicum miliaceum]|uniref:Uncharacterized protein n=1 Tax=Panicum miliaceum TaxID=4540 RepID=A0A3L6QV01_PANMI|nr:hypothetical protein C2845_PM04G12020 [Panicum miliaceum]